MCLYLWSGNHSSKASPQGQSAYHPSFPVHVQGLLHLVLLPLLGCPHCNKYEAHFFVVEKERYFSAKVVLRGWAIHQEVC